MAVSFGSSVELDQVIVGQLGASRSVAIAIEAVSGSVILDQPRTVDEGCDSGVKRLAGGTIRADGALFLRWRGSPGRSLMLTFRVLLPQAGLVLCLGFLVGALVYFHVQDRTRHRSPTHPPPPEPKTGERAPEAPHRPAKGGSRRFSAWLSIFRRLPRVRHPTA